MRQHYVILYSHKIGMQFYPFLIYIFSFTHLTFVWLVAEHFKNWEIALFRLLNFADFVRRNR
jgi:hypothetical protein